TRRGSARRRHKTGGPMMRLVRARAVWLAFVMSFVLAPTSCEMQEGASRAGVAEVRRTTRKCEDLSFVAARAFDAGLRPRGVVLEGFDGDGVPDIAVVGGSAADESVSVLLGHGDGTFGPPLTSSLPIGRAGLMVAGDFNGNGVLDLAVADHDTDSVRVLLG